MCLLSIGIPILWVSKAVQVLTLTQASAVLEGLQLVKELSIEEGMIMSNSKDIVNSLGTN